MENIILSSANRTVLVVMLGLIALPVAPGHVGAAEGEEIVKAPSLVKALPTVDPGKKPAPTKAERPRGH
jgi:hypothetical protein